jgi:hypothetical protein
MCSEPDRNKQNSGLRIYISGELRKMNVREVVEIILALNGGRKFKKTCDQLIEGNWEHQVTGVVSTFMATGG